MSTSETAYLPRHGGPLPRLENVQAVSEVVASEPINDIERRVLT